MCACGRAGKPLSILLLDLSLLTLCSPAATSRSSTFWSLRILTHWTLIRGLAPARPLAHPSPTLQPTLIALHTHLAPQLQYEHATTGLRCQGPPRSRRARPTRGHYAARFGSTKGPTISILPLRSLRLSHGVIYDQASLEANGVPYTMSYSGRQALFCRDNYGNGWEVPPILAPYLCV